MKLDWDVPLLQKKRNSFQKWYSDLKYLNNKKIDIHVGYRCRKNWSIHTFCDASNVVYATADSLRCGYKDTYFVQLSDAISRLASKKSITIPRCVCFRSEINKLFFESL